MKGNVPADQAVTRLERPLPARVQEALGERVGVAQEGLLALSVGIGLGVLHQAAKLVDVGVPTEGEGIREVGGRADRDDEVLEPQQLSAGQHRQTSPRIDGYHVRAAQCGARARHDARQWHVDGWDDPEGGSRRRGGDGEHAARVDHGHGGPVSGERPEGEGRLDARHAGPRDDDVCVCGGTSAIARCSAASGHLPSVGPAWMLRFVRIRRWVDSDALELELTQSGWRRDAFGRMPDEGADMGRTRPLSTPCAHPRHRRGPSGRHLMALGWERSG